VAGCWTPKNPGRSCAAAVVTTMLSVRRSLFAVFRCEGGPMIHDGCIGLAEASRRLGRPGRALSDAIFRGAVDASVWPRVAGKVLVPISELERLRKVLALDRRLKSTAKA
jgi:hypothetical protein